jgi:hypothetical protein
MRFILVAALAALLTCQHAVATAETNGDTRAASVFLAPSGSDAKDCRSPANACRSLNRGYQVASLGEVVELAGGTYPSQVMRGAKSPGLAQAARVAFRPAAGATVRVGATDIGVPHLEFSDMRIAKWKARYDVRDPKMYGAGDLVFRNVDTHHFSLNGARHVRVLDSEVGPNRNAETGDWPQDGIFVGTYPSDSHTPTDIVFDGLDVHDVREPFAEAHSDCVQFTAGIDVTIRNSRFRDCEHADLMIKGDQGPIDGFLIENNFFDRTLSAFFSINLYETSRGCRDVVMRHNTALQNIRTDACSGGSLSSTIQPSMSSHVCSAANVTLSRNVYESGGACGAGDLVADVRYVDEAGFDLHLTPGSAAIGRGRVESAPVDDIDGQPRGRSPDAGADQHG